MKLAQCDEAVGAPQQRSSQRLSIKEANHNEEAKCCMVITFLEGGKMDSGNRGEKNSKVL